MGRNRTNYNNKYNKKEERYDFPKEDHIVDEKTEFKPYEEPIEDAVTVILGKVNIPDNKVLNVRSEPSMNADTLSTVNAHSEVVIIEAQNDFGDWYKICTAAGIDGYVRKEYVTGIHNAII